MICSALHDRLKPEGDTGRAPLHMQTHFSWTNVVLWIPCCILGQNIKCHWTLVTFYYSCPQCHCFVVHSEFWICAIISQKVCKFFQIVDFQIVISVKWKTGNPDFASKMCFVLVSNLLRDFRVENSSRYFYVPPFFAMYCLIFLFSVWNVLLAGV